MLVFCNQYVFSAALFIFNFIETNKKSNFHLISLLLKFVNPFTISYFLFISYDIGF